MNSPSPQIHGYGQSPALENVVSVETGSTQPVEVTPVPEPSPVFLLVGALALIFLLKRGGNGGS